MPNASTKPKHGRRTRRRHRDDPARNELVSSSLESAQQCLFNQDYGTAFVHYLLALNLAPVFKDFAKDSFRFTLSKWAEELDSVGRIQDLFNCYEQALELFPDDEVILNSMGEHLFRMGFRDEAAGHFHKALKLRPDYPEARENFYRVANWLVERWHFLMLNDHRRNQKYQQAIERAVQSGCSTVLDIGTGTGILGMCAKKAGASEVYACELSKTMYELACEVVSANGLGGSINILHMKSLEMEVPRDIPKRVSLVVTETVDAGLFGEGIMESLIHAWHNLLLPRQSSEPSATGRVIPAGATVFGMAIKCPEIRRHHGMFCALVCLQTDHTKNYCVLECAEMALLNNKEYHNGFQYASHWNKAYVAVDDRCLQELEGLSSRPVQQMWLPVTQEGELDALAVWFQLHLDEDNSLSTKPHEDTCWEQAIYPVHTTKGFALKPGDTLLVEVSCRDAYLRLCSVAVLRGGQEIRLDKPLALMNPGPSQNPEAELCSALACLQTDHTKDYCVLECAEMALLNNKEYHNSFQCAVTKLISRLKLNNTRQEAADSSELFYVLDVSEGFSLLSLIAASQGHVKAYSSVEKNKQQEVLKRLARSNNIPEESLEFWLNGTEDEQGVLQRPSTEKLWSAIILDCVETCGLVRQKLMEKASLAREDIPERIVVYGMLVESDMLLLESAVQGQEPTLGFNIAPFINQFTVPVHVFLDFSTLECKHLSESVELFVLDLMDTNANYTTRQVKVTTPGTLTNTPFSDCYSLWYHIYLDQDICVSTLSQNSHWKQAAVVLQEPLQVSAGDWLCLTVNLHKSTISMSAQPDGEPRPMG
uniref:Protein arginine N-methyltransferase 9 n=1 Tax=Neogobius melanostomus TaxID=47308 RepID=A0A8C6U265_9GOBI